MRTWAISAARRSHASGCALVFPACVLNYMGQGALILGDPKGATGNPFFQLAPGWAQLPMVFLAAAATVIASQAVISGAFSVTQQAARLGLPPPAADRAHLGADDRPDLRAVDQLGAPRRRAHTRRLLPDVQRARLRLRRGRDRHDHDHDAALLLPRPLALAQAALARRCPAAAALVSFDLLFLAANRTKILHGAWLPLVIALAVFTVLTTWQKGRGLVTKQRGHDEGQLRAFIEQLHELEPPLPRVPGTAVFLNRGKATAPLALRGNVEHNHVLHENVLILSVETRPRPHVPDNQRLAIDDLGYADDGITHVTARFGYMDKPDVPGLLPLIRAAGVDCGLDDGERLVLPLDDRAAPRRHARHEPVAEEPLPRDLPAHRRCRRVLPAPARAHGDHGLADRVLATLSNNLRAHVS